MPTGDGLLVRLMPAAPIPLGAMAGFCEAARRHGNGTIEISARGSLQVRGLTPYSAPLFAAAVADLGIAVQEGVPVIAGVGGDVDPLAADLRRAIADAQLALSPKVSVVVDGDGPLHLDGLTADVRLRAVGFDRKPVASAPRFHLGIGGAGIKGTAHALPLPPSGGEGRNEGGVPRVLSLPPAPLIPAFSPRGGEKERAAASGNGVSTTWLGTVAPSDAVEAVISILSMIAAHGPAARAADVLSREGVAALQVVSAIEPGPSPLPRAPAEMIGLHAMRDDTVALGIGLAFGHTHADALVELVGLAAHYDGQALRPAPDRTLLLTGISAPDARDLTNAAERLGFVVRCDDPRRRIVACPGAPACASGFIAARTLASGLSPILAPILGPERSGTVVHISGCPKGCAHPAPAVLTLVGAPHGCGIVYGGSSRETPHHFVDPERLGDEISRLLALSIEVARG
jgi:precorrin-3B synthase